MKYVIDLDGTLCRTPETRTEDGGFVERHYDECTPYMDRIEAVNKLYDAGHTIIIDTARGASSGTNWLEYTRRQLASWGLRYHRLRVGVKIGADVYVDDRAIRPEDFFPEVLSDDSQQDTA
jgi:hypothetical protein